MLPPEPVSLSIASILKMLLLEGVFCDQKELAESHRNRKPGEVTEMKHEHAGRQKESDGRKNVKALREPKSRRERGKRLKLENKKKHFVK